MKTFVHRYHRVLGVALAAMVMMPTVALTSNSGSRDRDVRSGDSRQQHQEIIEDLLDMSVERLARTRSVIERLEGMDEKQREILRKRVRDFHRQTPEEIRRQREEWRAMTQEERRDHRRRNREEWEELWGLDIQEGDVDVGFESRFKEYFQVLSSEERLRVMRELIELPASDD